MALRDPFDAERLAQWAIRGQRVGMPRKWFILVSGTITGPRPEGHPHEEQSIPCHRCQSAGSRGRAVEAGETVRRVAGRVPSTGSAQTLYPVGLPAASVFTSA